MQRKNYRGLIALNAILLGVLAIVTFAPSATGQPGQRARGNYTIIGGSIQGGNSNAVYILDSSNQEIVAVRWDQARSRMQGLGYRSLVDDAQLKPGR